MLRLRHGAAYAPKTLEAVREAIYNDAEQPLELLKLHYRKIFGLSAQEMEDEPADQFFTNLQILAEIEKKERIAEKVASKNHHG